MFHEPPWDVHEDIVGIHGGISYEEIIWESPDGNVSNATEIVDGTRVAGPNSALNLHFKLTADFNLSQPSYLQFSPRDRINDEMGDSLCVQDVSRRFDLLQHTYFNATRNYTSGRFGVTRLFAPANYGEYHLILFQGVECTSEDAMANCTVAAHEQREDKFVERFINVFDQDDDDDSVSNATMCVAIRAALEVDVVNMTAYWVNQTVLEELGCNVSSLVPVRNAHTLFFSEYLEGLQNNKYIEIYNPTCGDFDMSTVEVWLLSNGGDWNSPNNRISLSGTLAHDETFTVCNSQLGGLLSLCDFDSSDISFGGDDAVGLAVSGVLVDTVGTDGADPGIGAPLPRTL